MNAFDKSALPILKCLLLATLTAASLLSCQQTSQPLNPSISDVGAVTGDKGTPLEASPPNNTQGLQIQPQLLYEGLDHPWGMAWLPDGSLLITERPGRLKHLSADDKNITSVAGVPPVFASGQGGLLDITLHPRFAENQWVYFTYADGDRSSNRTKVARAKFDGKTMANWSIIFEVSDLKSGSQHFGSRLAWLPDETLLISIGDGGNPPLHFKGALIRKQAQNLGTHFGKIIRIKDDGSIPADNPFVNQAGALPEIWSYGHRNIQGLTVDPATGEVWATEHGSRGGDELNRLEKGKNYGWPLVSFSQEYTSPRQVAPVSTRPGFQDPKVVWTPSIAPSGLAVYQGDRIPAWKGNILAGALVNEAVFRYEVDTKGNVRQAETIQLGQRVRDVRQGPDGFLYVLTDHSAGRLIRLQPKTD